MSVEKTMLISRCFLLCMALAAPLQGLGTLEESTEEVEYIRYEATATVGGSVTLDCGSTVPSIFIWAYAEPGSGKNMAVAYDYGQGPKLQAQAEDLGQMTVVSNTSSLLIREVRPAARGTYTCQALYDMDDGAKIIFYFTQLRLEED